jgi:hypothetical protein
MWYVLDIGSVLAKRLAKRADQTGQNEATKNETGQTETKKVDYKSQITTQPLLDELGKDWEIKLRKYPGLMSFLDRVERELSPVVKGNIGKFYGILWDTELEKLESSYNSLTEKEIGLTIKMLRTFYTPYVSSPSVSPGRGMAFISVYKSDPNDRKYYDTMKKADEEAFKVLGKGLEDGNIATEEEIRNLQEYVKSIVDQINQERIKEGLKPYEEKRKFIPIRKLLDEKLGPGNYEATYLRGAWVDTETNVLAEGEGGFTVINIDLRSAVEIGSTYDQWTILYAKDGKWWWIECNKALEDLDSGLTEEQVLEKYSDPAVTLPKGDLLIPIFKTNFLEIFPEASGVTYIPGEGGIGVKAIRLDDLLMRKEKLEEGGPGVREPKGKGPDDGGGPPKGPSGGAAALPIPEEKEEPLIVGPDRKPPIKLRTEEEEEKKEKEKEEEEEESLVTVGTVLKKVIASVVEDVLDWDKVYNYVKSVEGDKDADMKIARFIRRQIESSKEEILATLYERLGGKISLASKSVDYFNVLNVFGERIAEKLGYKGVDPAKVIYRIFIENLKNESDI